MPETGTVTVELFGIPRQCAGRAEVAVRAGTVGELLAEVARACPALSGMIQPNGRLAPQYLLSLDGQRFLQEPHERLQPGDRVLLLSADAGG